MKSKDKLQTLDTCLLRLDTDYDVIGQLLRTRLGHWKEKLKELDKKFDIKDYTKTKDLERDFSKLCKISRIEGKVIELKEILGEE